MALSRLLDCILCGSQEKEASQDSPPTPYEIEGKPPQTNTNSQDSFASDSDLTKTDILGSKDVFISEQPSSPLSRPNRALVVASKRCYDIVDSHPFPLLEHDREVIISTKAVGLNPIDWKSVDYNFCLPEFPWITGREMAGVVEAVGPKVKDLKIGDRVWTSTYYRDRRAGCFQEYVTVPDHTVLPIPSNLDFNSAACLGVAGLTAAMTLWRWLKVPRLPPTKNPLSTTQYVLIWGGSTVTGQFAIQITVRCGLNVIAVTSKKTKSLAQGLGAHVVTRDGKSEKEIVTELRSIAGNNITRAIDLVGTHTANHCLQALSTDKPAFFAPLAMISSNAVIPENISVEMVEMKQFVLDAESKEHALELNRLVEERLIALPSIEVLEGGLDSIQKGLERSKSGDMVGRKLIVSMS